MHFTFSYILFIGFFPLKSFFSKIGIEMYHLVDSTNAAWAELEGLLDSCFNKVILQFTFIVTLDAWFDSYPFLT